MAGDGRRKEKALVRRTPRRLSEEGVTLTELLTVVTIVGILAAIAVPSYASFLRRSKAAEAPTMLGTLFQGVASLYERDISQRGAIPGAGATADRTRCHLSVDAALPQPPGGPGSQKYTLDWAGMAALTRNQFEAINFRASDPLYYVYTVDLVGGTGTAVAGTVMSCGDDSATGDPIYDLQAVGDLDSDGVRSLYELSVGVDGNGLYRNPGVYSERPNE